YQVQEQGDPRLRQRLCIKPEEVLVTRFCQPEGGGSIQLLPGCRIERRIRVHFHQRLNDILPDGFDFTGHFHEVQKGTVTAKVSEAVAFGVCFQEKVTGKHGVYMSTVTTDFIRAADLFQYQGCPGKDVLFGKPGKEMFAVFAGRDVLCQIPVALM
ncbi:hypothetical protein HMPREF9533_03367, partial [Escherichia coli MS 60-1]